MGIYIHTNVLGTFVFDKNFRFIEKIDLKNLNVDFSEWLDSEKGLIKKHKGEKFYVGFKNETLEGIKLTKDIDKFSKIWDYFKKDVHAFFKPNLILTKQDVKRSVNEDLFIIHAINNIDEIDKSTNMLTKRLREWYELYLPEFSKSVGDNEAFAGLILKKNKKQLLAEIKLNENETMGAELSKSDLVPIFDLAGQIIELYKLRKKHEKYLDKLLSKYCPNLQAIAGTMIGARLLAMAGSLKKMVLFPASTIQLLGAEKALFRHMKTGAKPPKYGFLINHPLVNKASKQDKGRVARAIADKISLAVKIDYYKGEFIGDKYMKELEERFK
ncbi:hypothetical protein KY330_02875 [Candidatus Woesearchaeota archaeon]|nr:hypothetical protein [Candidatus Woesearchaeota archaeon]